MKLNITKLDQLIAFICNYPAFSQMELPQIINYIWEFAQPYDNINLSEEDRQLVEIIENFWGNYFQSNPYQMEMLQYKDLQSFLDDITIIDPIDKEQLKLILS